MRTLDLNDAWSLHPSPHHPLVPDEIPATVPGCVMTDLIEAGLIPDPYLGTQELEVQWVGGRDWRYSRGFKVPPELLEHERIDLVCDGLDTVCTLTLEGHQLGVTANMHHPHRFDVTPYLSADHEHGLSLHFASALTYARNEQRRLGPRPHVETHPFHFARKMACNYGWDWGPIVITAGIWKAIRLEAWSTARLSAVRPLVLSANAESARLEVQLEVETLRDVPLRCQVELERPESGETLCVTVALKGKRDSVVMQIPEPELWWPRGYGEQPLYPVRVRLLDGAGQTLDTWERKVGLRQVALDTSPDSAGSRFVLQVNDTPIFCKGANWIPDDCFPHRVTEARYRERLEQACDAHMNMLRVWGGGIYESDTFYDLCDALGILVWQDFLFACAMYAEEEPLRSQVAQEARHNITRLSHHPSLVLWNGCNENIWAYFDWGDPVWKDQVEGMTWGAGYYFTLLPGLMAALDPSRPYTPASPWSGSMDIHPLNDAHGTHHIWDVWVDRDAVAYRDHRPRFASEFGFQAPANHATLAAALPADALDFSSEAWTLRQKQEDGNTLLLTRLHEHFAPHRDDFDTLHFLTQLGQARAVSLGVEWFRSLHPHCMGALYWQLNDCWPAISWSAIDSAGCRKLLWYATQRFFAPRLITLQPRGEDILLHAHNDTPHTWQDAITVRRMRMDGSELASMALVLDAPPRSRVSLSLDAALTTPVDPTRELLVAEDGSGLESWYGFVRDKEQHLPAPQLHARLQPTDTGYTLTIEALSLLRDLCIFVDRLDPHATISDQLVTLLPGQHHTFTITTEVELREDVVTAPPIFWTAHVGSASAP